MTTIDAGTVAEIVGSAWRDDLVGELSGYIAIPALSPAFDPEWKANGHLSAAVDHIHRWIRSQPIAGLESAVVELPGRTPVLLAEIPAYGAPSGGVGTGTVLLYGHCDKQPEMTGWDPGLGPWTPVRRDDLLYGRGGADDGYAAYASLTAIRAVQESGGSHPRCVVLIEASEESGSPDLHAHVAALSTALGDVKLVVCLDSGCATYDTLWLTSSLRGMVAATVRVDVLTEGVHSGSASGVVPSSFRVLRQLLDRIEDPETGAVLLDSATSDVPDHRRAEIEAMVDHLGGLDEQFPYVAGIRPMASGVQAQINRTWLPTVSYIGADGLPPTNHAGNVLRPSTSLRLSLRLPPTVVAGDVLNELRSRLVTDPPDGATVTVEAADAADGWNAPDLAPWLSASLHRASVSVFGRPAQLMGEGGSIPFMGMLGRKFPAAQFAVMGVLGPGSNAHGPNEFLHLPYAERLTNVLASVLADA